MRKNLAVFLCSLLVAAGPATANDHLGIVTLSNRADLVSGGEALVEVAVPRDVALSAVTVSLNANPVTAAFQPVAGRHALRGLLTGLVDGRNDVVAETGSAGRDSSARLEIINHPIGGPVLSGPHIVPFFCATPVPQPATETSPATNASGLSTPAFDAQCNMATEYKLYYRTTTAGCSFAIPDPSPAVNFLSTNPPASATPPANPCFKPYVPGDPPPADLAMTATDAGLTVPYIVRVERGTMNRGIYDIAVLFDPVQPWNSGAAPQAQWNGKILYQFGVATGQPRRQFRSTSVWTNDMALSRGFLVAQNSMTDSAINSNRVSMAETVMMMKEHVGDRYGPVTFTIGTGCSGGSINSNMNASIMPGNLDGIVISCAYPDSETTGMEVGDCVLLAEAYQKPQWTALQAGQTQAQVDAKKAAINGHLDQRGCHAWYNSFGNNGKVGNYVPRGVVNATTGALGPIGSMTTNNCQLPFGLVWSEENPSGARCSAWDWAASIFGEAPDGMRARETRDNTGVQFGLRALLSGAITAEEFVTLNEIVGGVDKDSNFQAARSVADPKALETAYRAGIVLSGRQYAKTAVIDLRGWDDTGIHHQYRTFSIRERLEREYGDHDSQVIWWFSTGLLAPPALSLEAFLAMNQWLTNLEADASPRPVEKKVRAAKPAGVVDFCVVGTERVTDLTQCESREPRFKVSASPRQVAGGALSENILKCRLKPLSSVDYAPLVFTAAQWARLQAVFPDGVCDWEQRGVEQQRARSPLTFENGAGGESLPREPASAHGP